MATLINPNPRETLQLGSLTVPRLFVGLWQLSSPRWGGAVSVARVRREMLRHLDAGFNAFADHYGPAEEIFGKFRGTLPDPSAVIGATKWCVFGYLDVTREAVEAAVDDRNSIMRSQRVDLLQFHWQDYEDRGYLEALEHLQDIKNTGKIREIGLCNFDAKRTEEICAQLPGLIVSNQVAFSIIDTRPLDGMNHVCERHGVKLLTYGTLCGGFLSEKWLGQLQPDLHTDENPGTPSQKKYLDIILDGWGNWSLFQELLRTLQAIGYRHESRSIANVATRWVLDHSFVGAVIVGSRLGISEHVDDNDRAYGFRLTEADKAAIESVLAKSKGRHLIRIIGDCGAEYRRPEVLS